MRVSNPLNELGEGDDGEADKGGEGYRVNVNTARTPSGRSNVDAIIAFSVLGGGIAMRPHVETGVHVGSLIRAWAHGGEKSSICSVGMMLLEVGRLRGTVL